MSRINKIFGIAVNLITFLIFSNAIAANPQQLHGHVPKFIDTAPLLGSVPTDQILQLAIGLPFRNKETLHDHLKKMRNRKLPESRYAFTPQEVTDKFGPSQSDYQAVINFAKSNSLSVIGTNTYRTLLFVSGTVGDIQKAFHLKLNYYKQPDGNKIYAPDKEPSVDLDVPLLEINGLTQLRTRHNVSQIKGSDPIFGGYMGNDFRNAYNIPNNLTGDGQTVALVEKDIFASSDVLKYAQVANLNLNAENYNNFIYVKPVNGFNEPLTAGNQEVALDIEMIISMAPQAKVFVYEGNPIMVLNQIAMDNSAEEISSSITWDPTEQPVGLNIAQIFQVFELQKQSFFQASGDFGAYVPGDFWTQVQAPMCGIEDITVVGGTELYGNLNNNVLAYDHETTWNNPIWVPNPNGPIATPVSVLGGASGGGICNGLFPLVIPYWQSNLDFSSNDGSPIYRNIPDVSMVADNILVYATAYNNVGDPLSQYPATICGTSASAPLWAGFMALVNQQGVSNGTGPVGFANPALYSLATTNYSNDFHGMADATSNNLNGNNNLYPSVAGYNLATGWGSPNGQNLINDLAPVVSINTPTPIPTSAPVPIANLNWSSMTSMLSNRSNFSVGVVNGILYAIGGQNGVTVTNEMDEFIPSSYNPGANNFHYQQLVPTYRFVFLMEFFTQSEDLTEVLICLKWRPIIQPPTLA